MNTICDVEKGKQIDTDLLDKNNPYPYINGGIEASGNYFDYNTEGKTITVSEGGASCGYVGYIESPFWCGCHCYRLSNIKINPKYLYFALKANQNRIMTLRTGSAMPNIKKSAFEILEIKLADDNEIQANIVKTLETLEVIICNKKKQLEELDTLIKARFVEMFGTLQDNENNYKIVTIEDVCSMIKDGTHQTPTYIENRQGGYKFLSSKDVMTQKIDWTDIKYIPAELHEKLYATIKPQRNDILMSKNGVNYGVAAVNDTDEVFDIYVSLALLRPIEQINPIYFRCVINNPDTKRQFDGSIKGIGVPNLHLGEIKKTKIILPPIELQNEFEHFVTHIDKLRVEVQKSLDEMQTLFDSLMQKYFG